MMLRPQRLVGASTLFLRQSQVQSRSQWRGLTRLANARSQQPHVAKILRQQRRFESTESTAAEVAKSTASAGSRIIAYVYGTAVVLVLGFGYLYITDTRASIHQWLVVPALRMIHYDPEEAHHSGIRYISALHDFNLHPRERGNKDQELGDLRVEVFGHVLDNPLGTSAGIDKDAEIPSALFALGPAIVEVGGVTPLAQEGNPKPRVFRIPSQNALINRYGLNSQGADHVAMQLRERVRSFAYANGLGIDAEAERMVLDGEAQVPPGSLVPGKLLAVQVAKNKTTPDNDIFAVASDYAYCVEHLAKYADILVVNVSSPNTPGLRDLQAAGPLTAILTAVVDAAKSCDRKTKPAVMVKVSPDEDSDAQIEGICSAVWASGVDGVIVGNTTKKRPEPVPAGYIMPAQEAKILTEVGGYSGPQMFNRTLNLVKRYRSKLDLGPPEELQTALKDAKKDQKPAKPSPVEAESKTQSPSSLADLAKGDSATADAGLSNAETTARDARRLKPETKEASAASQQSSIKIPERHASSPSTSTSSSVEDESRKVTGPSSLADLAKGDSATADAKLSPAETTARDAQHLKPVTAEADAASKQPSIKFPERHSSSASSSSSSSASAPAPASSPSTAGSTASSQQKVIFATGGITNGEQCLQILNAGASVCQVYTAMMYGGVGTITRMKEEMRQSMKNGKQQ